MYIINMIVHVCLVIASYAILNVMYCMYTCTCIYSGQITYSVHVLVCFLLHVSCVDCMYVVFICCYAVNHGDYIKAVLDRNLAENITRVLYPNDNVRTHTVYTLLFNFVTSKTRCVFTQPSASDPSICVPVYSTMFSSSMLEC